MANERKWAEIRNDYLCEDADDLFWRIDAWLTDDDNEEGKVIAFVDHLSGRVLYVDPQARIDAVAQEKIRECRERAEKAHPMAITDMESAARRLLSLADDPECSADALCDAVRAEFYLLSQK